MSFTLYPPGYAPYQRRPVVRLAEDGGPILPGGEEDPGELDAFEQSIFQGALDARRRRPWPRDSEHGPPESWWSTQRRHLELALALTGISRTITERTRELIATVLAVPLLAIAELSRRELRGYQSRGAAVAQVLALVQPGRGRARRLLLAGHLAGCWGRPRICHPISRSLELPPFYLAGTPAPT